SDLAGAALPSPAGEVMAGGVAAVGAAVDTGAGALRDGSIRVAGAGRCWVGCVGAAVVAVGRSAGCVRIGAGCAGWAGWVTMRCLGSIWKSRSCGAPIDTLPS
ncbi:hypothetical protein, partial [Sphingosinicella sp. YJ22]|uniref:hypothetical protein n=1 Tax=Sphingosinicella sp. YJ22 TaxID=1104780 RepID=UPI00140A39A0